MAVLNTALIFVTSLMMLIFLSVNTSVMFSCVYIPQRHLSGLVFLLCPSSDSEFFRTGVSVSNSWQKE